MMLLAISEPAVLVLIGAAGLGIGAVLVFFINGLRARGATRKAGEIVSDAEAQAERTRKEAEIAAKEEFLKRRESVETEMKSRRGELRTLERRIAKREDNLDRKVDVLNKKEHYIETLERNLAQKRKEINAEQAEMERLMEATDGVNHIITECVGQVLDPAVTREDLDEYLKEKGWRKPRGPAANESWRWAAMSGTENVLFMVMLPRIAFDFVRKLLGRWLSLAPEKPEAILPVHMDVGHEDKARKVQ